MEWLNMHLVAAQSEKKELKEKSQVTKGMEIITVCKDAHVLKPDGGELVSVALL